ncbi:MAG: PadR family transcriptional regulator [Rhodospirillaceae bacterium]|nr:PadR family transcriptional regulator [Rhodospirillaceae bacterium]
MDLSIVCLALLSRSEASGYEITKKIEGPPYNHFCHAGFSAVYAALRRLAGEGVVEARALSQQSRPDKTLYRITPTGTARLETMFQQTSPGEDVVYSDFLFALFFADLMPAEAVGRLIDQRIAWYRGAIARLEACAAASGETPFGHSTVRQFGLAVYRAALAFLEENRPALAATPTAADKGHVHHLKVGNA